MKVEQANEMINKLEKLHSDFSKNYESFRTGFDEVYEVQDSLLEFLSQVEENAIGTDGSSLINKMDITPIDVPEIDISIRPAMRRIEERNEEIADAIKE